MASGPVTVSIQGPDGSCIEIHVEHGSAVSQILDHEALRLPAGYCARLVTENAEVLEPDSKVWESQVWRLKSAGIAIASLIGTP